MRIEQPALPPGLHLVRVDRTTWAVVHTASDLRVFTCSPRAAMWAALQRVPLPPAVDWTLDVDPLIAAHGITIADWAVRAYEDVHKSVPPAPHQKDSP